MQEPTVFCPDLHSHPTMNQKQKGARYCSITLDLSGTNPGISGTFSAINDTHWVKIQLESPSAACLIIIAWFCRVKSQNIIIFKIFLHKNRPSI